MRGLGHRRSRKANKTIAVVAALLIGGGGATALAVNAFGNNGGQGPAAAASTIDCPDASMALDQVPEKAKEPVGQKLAQMDAQVAQAFGKLKSEGVNPDEVLGELNQQRAQTIQQMGQELKDAGGQAPAEMQGMADCKMKQQQVQEGEEGQGQQASGPVAADFVDIKQVVNNVEGNQTAGEGGSFTTECGKNDEEHFNADNVIAAPGVKAGAHHVHDYVGNLDTSFASSDQSLAAADTTCAKGDKSTHYWPVIRSLDGKQDEVQIDGNKRGSGDDAQVAESGNAPEAQQGGADQGQAAAGGEQGENAGADQGAENAGAENAGAENAGAENAGPGGETLVRLQNAGQGEAAAGGDQAQNAGQGEAAAGGDQAQQNAGQGGGAAEEQDGIDDGDGGQADGNVGTILQPESATLKFIKGGSENVVAMPQFLRIITGDAKSFTNGDKNANASWSCEGFEDKVQLKDKYPICPEGAQVVRTFKFQNCWDGQNTDSGNHRDHMSFMEEDGTCPDGFQAVPQLTHRLAYDIPQKSLLNADTPFAVDSFEEQIHKPITDHDDFINVMPEDLMNETVDCVNTGKQCGGEGKDTGGDEGKGSKDEPAPSKPDKDAPEQDQKPDKDAPEQDQKDDTYNSAMQRDKESSESDAKQDKDASASEKQDEDKDSNASEKRDEGAPPPDRKTQLANEDGDLPNTGSDTPVGLIVGIAAAVLAAGSAQVWWLRRRNAVQD